MGISIMIASSLVLRPVVEKLFGPPASSFSSSDLSKGTFNRMDDGDLRLRGVRGGESESVATVYVNGDRHLDLHEGSAAGSSDMMGERSPRDLVEYLEDSGIKVHTQWKISSNG